MISPRTLAVLVALAAAAPVAASPRDELLRAAPRDAAMVVLVQNARDHARRVADSPFAAWFPTTPLGKLLGNSADLKAAQASGRDAFAALGVTPDELLDDVVGDALGFAFSPSPTGDEKDERAVVLVRPRKPETLRRVIDRLNEVQKQDREITAVVPRPHAGGTYFERQKATGGPEFYCFRGGVFAFSSNPADVRAVLERDLAAKTDLPDRLAKLGVGDAVLVVLVNPRALDADLKAKVAEAKGDERAVLERFAEGWQALDAAAVYLSVGADLELGVAAQFHPGGLTPRAKGWLTGARAAGAFWEHVPDDALVAVGGRLQATELLDGIASLLPEDGKKSLRAGIDDTLGPLVGKDRLPGVLAALGPDWGVCVGSPRGDQFLPTVVAAVHVKEPDAARSLAQAVEYGFLTARLAYNIKHADQIAIGEERDGDVVIKSLTGAKAFPPGFAPSFALKGGYLLVAGSPGAIREFAPRTRLNSAESVTARVSATAVRAYLQTHRAKLAKFLADSGAGAEKDLLAQFDHITLALEPFDRVEVVSRGDENGMRVALRVKLAKPLK